MAAFVQVARCASFSQAAARLGYVQSTVTAQIQSLERDLGCPLFDRLPRTVVLTAAGRALLPVAEQILDLVASARDSVASATAGDGDLTGSVTVSAPETLLTYRLPAVLSQFHAEHPCVTVHLRPTPVGRFRGETRRGVAEGAVDLAFVLDTPLAVAGFGAEPLRREPIAVIASPSHRLASAGRVAAADLDGEPLLLPEAPESGCAYRGQFERQLVEAHVSTEAALEFASIEAVKQCVIAGMGLSVLPGVAVDADVVAGRLRRLAWAEAFDVCTQVVWSNRRSMSPEAAAFVATARATLGEADSDATTPEDGSS